MENVTQLSNKINEKEKKSKWERFKIAFEKDKYLYLLLVPGILYFAIFCYAPMYGSIIAFKDYNPGKGIMASDWVGLKWFIMFFKSAYFGRLLKNTVIMSMLMIIWGFPIPILFALMLNEIKDGFFKRFTQTVSYLPHFISVVVIVGLMTNMLNAEGPLTKLASMLAGHQMSFLNETSWFRTLYVSSGVWQEFGWDSIIFLAALSNIDPQLYEAARIDGASRIKQTLFITLPGIMPTIIVLLILRAGSILSVGYTKIILMYSSATYSVADVISTYVYRSGLLQERFSFGAAVGLFNSVANFIILILVNKLSQKYSETSLW